MSRTSDVRDIGGFDLSFFKYKTSEDILKFRIYGTVPFTFRRRVQERLQGGEQ